MTGRTKIVYLDCLQAGISGDMLLAALLDLGASPDKVRRAVRVACENFPGCGNPRLEIREVMREGFRARQVKIFSSGTVEEVSGRTLIGAVRESYRDLGLTHKAGVVAAKAIRTIVEAEARLHGLTPNRVHLHEAGSFDTVADIIGTVVAAEDLRLLEDTKILSSPVSVGGGGVEFSHGYVSSPAPAALEILKEAGFGVQGGPVRTEVATPTGVALLVALAEGSTSFMPSMRPLKIGYGAGNRDLPGFPNILRVVLGEEESQGIVQEITVLETNLDDVGGEVLGYTIERLLDSGAKDVSVIPMVTKKSRPAHLVRVISLREDAQRLTDLLMRETGTLGVRMIQCARVIAPRESVEFEFEIKGKKTKVVVKIVKDHRGRVKQLKPEFEFIAKIAREEGLSFREVYSAVMRQAEAKFLDVM